jgi:single-strand DNA-binding protein
MPDNVITITGTLTRDPELRFLASGQSVTNMSVALNERWQDKKTKEWVDGEPSFFDVTCWGQLGENVCASLRKGQRVVVTGKMKQRKWVNTAGENRYGWNLIADEVAPSLRWATASVEQVERQRMEREVEPDEYVPPADDEPF